MSWRNSGQLLLAAIGSAALAVRLDSQSGWIEAKLPRFSILYQAGLEKDVPVVRGWVEYAERLMEQKYRVKLEHYRLSIFLFPAPTSDIDVNRARNICCSAGTGRDSTGRIDMLAPSSEAMRTTTERSSLGMPKNDTSYDAKILVSEYIPIAHYEVQNQRQGGWHYYDAPNWFVQGLQEYDAIVHTTERNRSETAQRLLEWAKGHPNAFGCCDPDLIIRDDYNGGASFMAFLATEFGEDIHRRLLASEAPTFRAALTEVTKPYSRTDLFARFEGWLRSPRLPPS